MTNSRNLLWLAVTIVIIGGLIFWQKQEPKELPTVRIGLQTAPAIGLVKVAVDKNFFADEGIKVEVKEFTAGKLALQALIGGSLDLVTPAEFPVTLATSENIAFGLGDKGENERAQIVREHLKLAELEDKKDKYPAELSGGQVQRIALARSLAPNPEVLLMDEPYGALDAYTRDKMQQWLLGVWATHKKTVVFVTHNIEEAVFLADRVLVLNHHKFTKEFMVPFARPRREEVKFTPEFSRLRKEIFESINSFEN